MRKRIETIRPEFVELMPMPLEEGILYISQKFRTASHLCACGCGERVVTPLSPSGWSVSGDANGISLYPSIGNWNYDCRSHYWIWQNKIVWGRKMSEKWIARIQEQDRRDKKKEVRRRNKAKTTLQVGSLMVEWWRSAWSR